ncbi:MAG: FIST C-terminal domain-containing protein [Burkholderiales bacterium]|nr:FIST C-terminal domain-containing protein [Burkholderiales bacterium]
MKQVHKAITAEKNSEAAGRQLGQEIRQGFDGAAPDAVVVFASAQHDYQAMLAALADAAGCEVIVGASSAGEYTNNARGEGMVSAMGLRAANSMKFSVGVGRELSVDPAGAAAQVVRGFHGVADSPMPYRSALVMTDALAGHTDALVEELTLATGGNYRFFGGGAGDDGLFQKTHIFAGREAVSNAVVALEILSEKPVGVGVSHGWEPAGEGLRVTESRGMTIVSLNGLPAIEAFKDFAQQTGQTLDLQAPMPFFLHNVVGIKSGEGYRLRVPLAINEDGSVACAAPVPEGAVVHLMKTTEQSAVNAARSAAGAALKALGGSKPGAAFVFDCVATRLRLGRAFEDELQACANLLPNGFVGCNTYGQIARAEGQFGGFHNCTAVVCVLPE